MNKPFLPSRDYIKIISIELISVSLPLLSVSPAHAAGSNMPCEQTHLDAALWLTAHKDHKVRVYASLGAHALIRNDQRRFRRDNFRDAWGLRQRRRLLLFPATLVNLAVAFGATHLERDGALFVCYFFGIGLRAVVVATEECCHENRKFRGRSL